MSHVPNELHEEFPQAAERISQLKQKNAHFARMAEDYHEVNRTIHRMETNVEPASDEALETLKKQRLSLKDQIATMIG